ncbi:MAG: hypothetical protein U9R68_05655, partial [Planctomycetota bacterium]|nr:hypothetical protein [Planctomycetota bacterium]
RDGRDRTGDDADALLHKYGNKKIGATRQPVFKGITANFVEEKEVDEDDDGDIDYTLQTWEMTVYVYNPWRRLYLNAPDAGLPLEDLSVQMQKGGNVQVLTDFGDVESVAGTPWLPWKQPAKPLTCTIRRRMNHPINADDKKLSAAIKSISLHCGGNVSATIDRIDSDYIDQAGNGLSEGSEQTLERGIVVEGGEEDPDGTEVLVVYIFLDEPDGGGEPVWFEEGAAPDTPPQGAVPIRFPRSVKVDTNDDVPVGGLPPEWVDGVSGGGAGGAGGGDEGVGFRAFPRVGDLNQVLCQFPRPAGEDEESFWPWVPRVAKALNEEEKYVKFSWNWKPEEGAGGGETGEVKRLAAANVFCAGGPWLDRIDNDGDGYADYEVPSAGSSGGGQTTETFKGRDTGRDFWGGDSQGMTSGDSGGRFGGSEIRVAGKINLNTATRETLEALGDGFGINGLADTVRNLRNAGPIESPADIVNEKRLETGGGSAPTCTLPGKGPVERLDLPYTLISNIATVRSDTYSIYGTVQYIDLQAMYNAGSVDARRAAVRRSRRFWALVDRSPCLCHKPISISSVSSGFIRPRVLNFQWMD